ncbi:maleylpyruvate isomerase N-terminal domain-containing protein [Longispora sp. K20-0274]|uniref:maleylpyruvate isomerase N-terminal domain-containing protein n=1 Tax=Longispora sp. K20-0274 TaxID=3088255 RepID=UPI0039999467
MEPDLFIAAGWVAHGLLTTPELAARWDEPSALAEFRTGGLAGHLARQVLNVERFLAIPVADDTPRLTLDQWHVEGAGGKGDEGLDSEMHVWIRARADEAAAAGPVALAASVAAALDRLAIALPAEDPGRWVDLFGDQALTLDDLLTSRLIEIVVHADDLAVSLGVPGPEFPAEVTELVLGRLLRYSVARNGAVAVLRALSRTERAPASVSAY